jgi:NADPH2:quinone reductase
MLRGRPGSPSGKREGVRVPVGATHAREDAAAAHQALEAGSTSGALLWRP